MNGRTFVQDMDLLSRLSHWIDHLDAQLQAGCGWLIFNSDRQRSSRIANFLVSRLQDQKPPVSYFLVPWRDFAIHAYVLNVELISGSPFAQESASDVKVEQEYKIASQVSIEMYQKMLEYELIMISGIAPSTLYELKHLDSVVDVRYRKQRPTVIIVPRSPVDVVSEFKNIDPADTYWDRIYHHMYETSLIAL